MKPRIKIMRGFPGLYGISSQWWCSGFGGHGVGPTPRLAYSSWLQSLESMRNVWPSYSVGNFYPAPREQQPTWLERWFGA